tara:strand:- start:483 stop:605 length:123 start_codon:yes stop_codon:yes gene_type:complete
MLRRAFIFVILNSNFNEKRINVQVYALVFLKEYLVFKLGK